MKRLWVGVLGGLLIAGQLIAKDAPAKKGPSVEALQPPPDIPLAPMHAVETVHVRVGSGNVLTFPSRVIRVAVGDEKIVAVHVVESRQVLLQGLKSGRSTVFFWLEDGRRLRYDLVVSPRVEVLEEALNDLDPRIVVEASPDGATLILSGKVDDEHVANQARQLAETMLGTGANGASRVVSLMQFPGSNDADLRLTSALAAVDPRIKLRRMQVGNKVSSTADAVVLEGRVKDIPALVRAITLAELQLGGVGGKIEPLSNEPAQSGRNRNFSGAGLQRLQGGDAPVSGLAAYVARGLILKSASGRVLSFLEVDELPQIMVSIRVLQVDRGRAKHLGIDYRLDGSDFSAGSFHQPGRTSLVAPNVPPDKQTIAGILGGNIVGTFVNRTLAVAAAIDFLQQKDVARSVAEPNITTLSGESASVLIGGEVPIPTTTVGNTASVQGFLFQDFGVRLDIRPTLAPSGLVALEISPSIVRPSSDLAVSGVPGFQVQSVQTTAKVAPGQTLVLGGLISFNDEIQKRGVPGLAEIPLFKHLFSWEGRTLSEQEILFVITPRILSEGPEDVADAIQWRDVEPIAAGSVIELPPGDVDSTAYISSATLGKDGLPPSFTKSSSRKQKGQTPAIIEDNAPPPPPPPSPSGSAPTPVPDIAPRYDPQAVNSTPEPPKPAPKETPIQEAPKTSVSPSGSSSRMVAPAPEPVQQPALSASSPVAPSPSPAPAAPFVQPPTVIVHADDAPVIEEPLAPEPKVAAKPVSPAKPKKVQSKAEKHTDKPVPAPQTASAKAQPSPSKPLAASPTSPSPLTTEKQPLPEVEKKRLPEKEAAKVPVSSPAQPPAAKPLNTSAPVQTAATSPRTTPQPIAKTTPATVAPATQMAQSTPPAGVKAAQPSPTKPEPAKTTQTAAPKPEPAKSITVAPHPAPPVVASTAAPKKVEPAPSPAATQPSHVVATTTTAPLSVPTPAPTKPREPEKQAAALQPVPSTTTASAKASPTTLTAQIARSITSAPAPTPPPSAMTRTPEKPVATTSRPTAPSPALATSTAQAGAASTSPTKPTSPVPTPAPEVYPYRKREPETPRAAAPSVSAPSTATTSKPGGPITSAKVNEETRAWLTRDYRIEVVVTPHAGDAWTRLAKRVTGDARHWQELARLNGTDENLTSEAHVKVPFEMLRPELQQEVIGKLLPKGSAAESDWKRMTGQH